MTNLLIMPPAAKFLKKIKDKNLKLRFQKAIDETLVDNTAGDAKRGDQAGVFSINAPGLNPSPFRRKAFSIDI
jgi:mRNA interferase RelE/StbE